MSSHTDDPTKWSDIPREFALGAAFGAAFFAVGASGATAGAGAVVISGTLLIGGTLVVGCPEKERPVAMCLGVVFGVAVMAGPGMEVGEYVSDRFGEEKKITAPAPANCNRDAVAKFAGDMKRKGYDVTFECR